MEAGRVKKAYLKLLLAFEQHLSQHCKVEVRKVCPTPLHTSNLMALSTVCAPTWLHSCGCWSVIAVTDASACCCPVSPMLIYAPFTKQRTRSSLGAHFKCTSSAQR